MIDAFQDSLLDYKRDQDITVMAPGFLSRPKAEGGGMVSAQFKLTIGAATRGKKPPLVSCLMVTKDRLEQAKLSVHCYRGQSWPNRELVVLDESRDERLRNWIASLTDPTIRVFPLEPTGAKLGELRNRAIDLAVGDMICQWDDDDLQHPARIEIAMAAMFGAKTTACFLIHETIWIPRSRRIGIRPLQPYCNTVLTVRDPQFRYAPLSRAEDWPPVRDLLARTPAALLNIPELYIYVGHGRNTYDDQNFQRSWQRGPSRAEGSEAEAILARLSGVYPIAEYQRSLGIGPAAASPAVA